MPDNLLRQAWIQYQDYLRQQKASCGSARRKQVYLIAGVVMIYKVFLLCAAKLEAKLIFFVFIG
ncbi:MAG: hypothetical protein IJQ86_08410 [Spirochaetia bacterium]|nr:hypothetical protein [Spirochaetia bacterium]